MAHGFGRGIAHSFRYIRPTSLAIGRPPCSGFGRPTSSGIGKPTGSGLLGPQVCELAGPQVWMREGPWVLISVSPTYTTFWGVLSPTALHSLAYELAYGFGYGKKAPCWAVWTAGRLPLHSGSLTIQNVRA